MTYGAQNCFFLALNAQITCTAIWISTLKLYFSSAAEAWLKFRRSLHCASFCTLTGRRRGMLVGRAGTILPCCWRRSCWCRRRGWRRRGSLVELISFKALLTASHRVGLNEGQMHSPSPQCRHIVAQHFGKIVVKSVFSEGYFSRD